jgi:hypothetical protein
MNEEIPQGYYCHDCPHWHKTDKGARCDYLNREDTKPCCFHLLWDKVKECGINRPEYKQYKFDGIEKTVVCKCGKEINIIQNA